MDLIFVLLIELIKIYSWVLVIYIIMSWFPNARSSSFGEVLARICEPYLEPFRRIIPPIGMIDISPLIAFFVLHLAASGLHALIQWF